MRFNEIGYKDEAGKQKYKWYATGLTERGNKKEAKEFLARKIAANPKP